MPTTDLTSDAGALTAAYTAPASRMFLIVHLEGHPSTVRDLVAGAELTVGRSRSATVMVDSEKVSRIHARFRRDDDMLVVADLGSRNGTRVNGERIVTERVLRAGDEVTIGPAAIVVGKAAAERRDTRVADEIGFEARLVAELDHAQRYRHSVALAVLRVTGDDRVIDALARAVRPMDLVGDLGGDQLGLVLPRLSRAEAEAILARMVAEARQLGAMVRAGIAVGPADGRSADELIERARTALRRAREPGTVAHAEPGPATIAPADVVIASPAMQRVYALVDRIADSMLTVLILGETGVGKELVAEALHLRSSRATGPLVKLNCASIPEQLLESELFGHEKGAFTGADRRRIGFFEAAHGGTIFLDEIGEMAAVLQAKLLRVLQSRTLTRVGGTEQIAVDVRVVAATHRDIEAEVKAGRFREDLYFRVAGFTLAVPPLRDRLEDLEPLAMQFARQLAAELDQPAPELASDAAFALRYHDWPGNVRELRNAIERAIVVCSGGVVHAEDLPDRVRDAGRRAAPHAPPIIANGAPDQLRDQLAEIERSAIVAALEMFGGNQTKTARRLGISRRALIYKLERLGLKPPPASRE